MCQMAKRLLAEKLIDNFYDECEPMIPQKENIMERLKTLLSTEHHDLLDRWEEIYAERWSEELKRFADYVAEILMTNDP